MFNEKFNKPNPIFQIPNSMGDIDLTFSDWFKDFDRLGKEEWVPIFSLYKSESGKERRGLFCAIISKSKVKSVLSNYNWDLLLGEGRPGLVTYYKHGKPIKKYERLPKDGIEPLVHWRTFNERKESFVEISEEFRLYFNLFEINKDDVSKVFIYISDEGDEEEVIRIEKNKVSVKLKFIKEYLSVKGSYLAIYFDLMRFSEKSLEEQKLKEIDKVERGKDYIYHICVKNESIINYKSSGYVLGKKLVSGYGKSKSVSLKLGAKGKYEKFIIGVDEEGEEIICSCNVNYQSNPGFLTPVFFKRGVLRKYYDNPDRYTVGDGFVMCEGFWTLKIMNNHREHVVVFLGELKNLPYKEQTYWRTFNITPGDRKISRVDYFRYIWGSSAEPEHPELYFKYKFNLFQNAWYERFGWHLFLPLSGEDAHCIKSLHVPTTSERKEFEDQVLNLTKILIDSLNKEKLGVGLKIDKKEPGSIDYLEAFLKAHGLDCPEMIKFLRDLQSLRSTGIAHRKGENYEKIKKKFKIDKNDLPRVFEDILEKCIWVLDTIENKFLK
jgi:hypothetical protein